MERNKGKIFLILAAAIWGCGLCSQKVSMNYLGTLTFTSIRCIMGGLMLIPIARHFEKREKLNRNQLKYELKAGLICGLILALAILTQQYGLPYTEVGKAGFIAALYILITPVIGLFLGKQCPKRIWLCILLALSGMYILCLYDGLTGFTAGDLLMLICAFLYAFQMQAIDKFVGKIPPVTLSCYQFIFCGLLCILPALLIESDTTTFEDITSCWFPILYSGLVSCGLGYTFQTVGQKYVEPNKASLLLSTETIFTLAAGMIFFNEILTVHEYIGCIVMLIAIILSQIEKKH